MTGRGFQELKTLRHMTWPMVFVFATFSVTTFSYGFDNVVFATIQAMDDFLLRFGDTTDPQTGKPALSALHQAFYNSLGLPAKALGVVVGGALSNYAGRKPSFMAMQVLCVVGVGLAYGARSFGTMLAGRVCLQGFVGWNALLVPMYSAEIAPAPMRGALVGLFVFAHQFGAFLCSFVTYRSSQHEGSDYAWQLPIAVGFLFPGLMFLVGWFLPESPRWLVRRNRHAKATEALRWLHRGTPDFDADAEVRLFEASLEEDGSTQGSWADLARGTNKIRTFIAVTSGLLNQLTGQSFVTQYGAVFVKSLHAMDPFKFNIVSRLFQALGPTMTFFLVDAVGRRPMYLVLGLGCTAALVTDGGLGTGNVTPARIDGIIGMTILFGFFYSAGYGAIGAILAAEVPHLRLRDKVNILVYIVHTAADFLVTFTLPYLLDEQYAGLGSKVGFIYGAIAGLGVVWAWFFVPETAGRSLEELEDLWRDRVPPRKFASYTSQGGIGAMITEAEAHPGERQKVGLEERLERAG